MIASWMLYVTLVSALFALMAVIAERLIGAGRRPVRFIWVTALGLSLLWPAAITVQRMLPWPLAPVAIAPFSIIVESARITRQPLGPDRAAMLDRGLAALWIACSSLLLVRLLYGVLTLRRLRRGWATAHIDGITVRLSANVGPAVVGLRSMDIVLPEWITTLDASLRAIVLRHEEEHRAARDPYLLFGAAVAVVMLPWNIALWFQAQRLRLAIEMDCDARVLRVHRSRERYGLLMMTVAQQRTVSPPRFAPLMSDSPTQLERRIRAMQQNIPRFNRLATYASCTMAIGAFALACSLRPDVATIVQPGAPSAAQPAAPSASSPVMRNDPPVEFNLNRGATPLPGNVAPTYPAALRDRQVEGDVLATFVVDTMGAVDMSTFEVTSSTDPLFTAAVHDALPGMRFSPAVLHGRYVRQRFQMPFQFNLSRGDDSPAAAQRPRNGARGPLVMNDNATYFEFQVDQQVTSRLSGAAPQYPALLRAAKIEGEVLAQFVVDTLGHPNMDTFKALKSTDTLFTSAVRQALSGMAFSPARVGGRPVKQLVQMPFQFNLSQ